MFNSIQRLATLGDRPEDADEERVKHRFLVYMSLLMSSGGLMWGTVAVAADLRLAAAIPYGYVVASAANMTYFAASKNFGRAQFVQILMSLVLPFAFQWTLGGFAPSGAVMLWAMIALLGALTFSEWRSSFKWLLLFGALTVFSGVMDDRFAAATTMQPPMELRTSLYVINIVCISGIVFGLMVYLLVQREEAIRRQVGLAHEVRDAEHRAEQATEAATKARKMGSYRLVRKLGEGGMGEVWLAEHQMLARPAAVKLIRPAMLDVDAERVEVQLTRFEREAQATASLRSPHTINLYDFGRSEDGAFYYVMEFLDGLTLQQLVERFGPVPPERAAFLLAQACDSLADAHHASLLHRDIKPANIIVSRFGRRPDHVHVLDFGLVKAFAPVAADTEAAKRLAEAAQLTHDNVLAGTPAYTSPESAIAPQLVDARSDLYSLGCVAYWLVTGQCPFEGDTPIQTVMLHVSEPVVPPSKRSEMPIPAAFEELILSCLEKKPEDRPESAEALRLQFEALAQGWEPERADTWWAHHMPAPQLPQQRRKQEWRAVFMTQSAPSGPSFMAAEEPEDESTSE